MSTFTIKYNASTYHIAGLQIRTQTTGADTNTGSVAYYAETTCGALTRGRLTDGKQAETVTEILAAAKLSARVRNKKVCLSCTKAAEEMIAQGAA